MSTALFAATEAARGAPTWLWVAAIVAAPLLIGLDLFVVARIHPRMSSTAAALWSIFWFVVGAAFAAVVWWAVGEDYAIKYSTGYMVEKALTIDQVFVIALIISTWRAPRTVAPRLVFIGLSVALLARLPFIALGTWLAESDSQLLRVADGLFFVVGGIILMRTRHEREDPRHGFGVHFLERIGTVVPEYQGRNFLVHGRRRTFTLAAVVLLTLITADLYFDIAVPLAFAFTKPPFIVLASTLLSMLGMRSLYVFVASLQVNLTRLKIVLAIIMWLVALDLFLYERIERPTWLVPGLVMTIVLVLLVGAWFRTRTRNQSLDPLDPSIVLDGPDLP
jgi:tellurite resistance protein TerC